jgi:hypothetical protein
VLCVTTLVSVYSERAAVTTHLQEEDVVSLKSVSPSEGSFQSGTSVTENASLPDLLQPEFVYKKHTDTGWLILTTDQIVPECNWP